MFLLLEREAGTGGGGQGLAARERTTDHRAHRRDLVLHLQEGAPDQREPPRQIFGHLGRRCDRVAAEEGAPRVEGPFAHASFPWSSLILPTVSLLCGIRSRGTLFLLDEDREVGHRSSHAMQIVHLSMSTTFTLNTSIPRTCVGHSFTQISHPLQ